MEKQSSASENNPPVRHWIVICPEPSVRGGIWARWYRENCVAIGWDPPDWSLEGPTDNAGWIYARNRLKEIQPGDKVMPFLLNWRIGPIGTVVEVKAGDAQWNPTVEKENYVSELGRRITVTWEQIQMPPDGKCAIVAPTQRPGGPLARHTVDELPPEKFQKLRAVLTDSKNWVDIGAAPGSRPEVETEVTPAPPPVAELSLLERDLQKFLSRNLHVIEKGLKPDPAYQLEEYTIDVGRIDLLCKDAQGHWVVIELKADWAGDDAVGQILGYMSWVRDNLPNGSTVRGILVCRNSTGRLKAAIKWVPSLSVKRFTLDFSIGDV